MDAVDLFTGLQLDIAYLHDRTDDAGLLRSEEKFHESSAPVTGAVSRAFAVLPVAGELEGGFSCFRQFGVGLP